MSKQLPSNPSLEQLKKQAKDLLKAHRSGASDACARVGKSLPRLSKSSKTEIRDARISLRDAQAIIAREYEFSSWPKLQSHIEEITGKSNGEIKDRISQSIAERPEDAAKVLRSMQHDPYKVATLMVVLGQDTSAELMKYFSDFEIEKTTQAIARLSHIDAEAQDQAFEAFEQHLQDGPLDSQDSGDEDYGDFARTTLEQAVGPRRAAEILARQGISIERKTAKYRPKLSKKYQAMKRGLRKKLESTPTRQMDLDEIREVLVSMAEISRTEGILALEDFVDGSTKIEDWLRDGLRLALDGTEPEILEDLLETQAQALVHSYETRCKMIVKGIAALHSGDNPRIVDHKLCSFYKPQTQL